MAEFPIFQTMEIQITIQVFTASDIQLIVKKHLITVLFTTTMDSFRHTSSFASAFGHLVSFTN